MFHEGFVPPSVLIPQNYLQAESNEFPGLYVKQFKFANIFNLYVNQHRGYVRRQSCLHCQQAAKHIINPVVAREAPLELSKEAAKEGEANTQGIFPKFKTLTRSHVIELKEVLGPSTLSNIKGQTCKKEFLESSHKNLLVNSLLNYV